MNICLWFLEQVVDGTAEIARNDRSVVSQVLSASAGHQGTRIMWNIRFAIGNSMEKASKLTVARKQRGSSATEVWLLSWSNF